MAHTPLFRSFIRLLQQARRENLQAAGKPAPLTKAQVQWSRRRFVKNAALAGSAALTAPVLSHPERVWSREGSRYPRIAIVGAGIAGLNAAYQLKKAGLAATVYEARERIGGRILTAGATSDSSLVADLGGHFINTDHEDILNLANEFNLKLFNRLEDAERFAVPEVSYYFDGRIRPEAEVAAKLRPLADQIANDAALLDEDFDRFAPILDTVSVTTYLNKYASKIPDPFIRILVENTIRTEYGVEPQDSSALQLIFNLPTVDGNAVDILGNSDEAFVVEGGSRRITDNLASQLTGQIQTNRRLVRIQPQERGYRLIFEPRQFVDADYVILAIPFTTLRLVDVRVNLPLTLREFIRTVNLGSNEKVFAEFRQRVWRRENGFITDIWTDLGFSSAWDETQRQPDRRDGVLTFFFGGNQTKALAQGTNEVGRQLIQRFDQAIPGARTAATGRFSQTQWTQDPFTRGSYTSFKPGQLTKFGEFLYIEADNPDDRQDVHVDNLIFAGEHLSDEFYGYMNGAAQTGRLAAEVIIRKIQEQAGAKPKPPTRQREQKRERGRGEKREQSRER
jgi:monoamine oxidase